MALAVPATLPKAPAIKVGLWGYDLIGFQLFCASSHYNGILNTDPDYCNQDYLDFYDGWAAGQAFDNSFGVATQTSAGIFTALAAAEALTGWAYGYFNS